MLTVLLAATVLAQADAPATVNGTLEEGVVADLSSPPKLNRARAILCSCASAKAPDYLFTGLVVDAELVLGPDKRSAAERQATVFRILSAAKNGEPINVSERTKIFHETNVNKCGVTFDYGKQYMVYAHKIDDDAYETDYCLMNAAFGDPVDDAIEAETIVKSEQ